MDSPSVFLFSPSKPWLLRPFCRPLVDNGVDEAIELAITIYPISFCLLNLAGTATTSRRLKCFRAVWMAAAGENGQVKVLHAWFGETVLGRQGRGRRGGGRVRMAALSFVYDGEGVVALVVKLPYVPCLLSLAVCLATTLWRICTSGEEAKKRNLELR